jgi:hypothetical protein
MKTFNPKSIFVLGVILVMLACSFPGVVAAPTSQPAPPVTDTPFAASPTSTQRVDVPSEIAPPSPTSVPPTSTNIPHFLIPVTDIKPGKKIVSDAVSVDTAAEKRAPYGDSYKYNWFERPFMQDMTYVPDLDIVSYNLAYDEKFFFVSIELVGTDPNNEIGINYAVELDMDADGFGDYVVVAHPPYDVNWTMTNVQIAQDTNHDTGGPSAERSDAPFPGDGYDTIIFDGARGVGDDQDIAWVRINAGRKATVQIAFKRAFAGNRFLFGVFADGGLKDIGIMDYVDRYTEEEAGSPEKSEPYYPLKAVYGMDNVCRDAFGITNTNGLEPQRCKPTK